MPEGRTDEVMTVITISRAGETIERVVYETWWKKLSLKEIADTIEQAVKEIV